MKLVDFNLDFSRVFIDDSIISKINEKFNTTNIPNNILGLLTIAKDGQFFEDGCRLLSFEEILSASDDFNINFAKHGIIPLFDVRDNNYIVYNFEKNKWQLFNIVDEETFKEDENFNNIINSIYGEKKMYTIELSAEIIQEIADITTQYAPEAWVMVAIEAIMKNNELSFSAEALDSEDVQYEIDTDSEDRNALKAILLQPMKEQACAFFRFEVTDDGDYTIEFA